MTGPNERDEIAAVLAGHWAAGMAPSGSPHQWECACGEPLEMSDEAHVQHTADALTDLLAERDRRTAATAVRAMGAKFRIEARETWGGDVGWTTTGSKVAVLAASWCDQEAERIERGE